MLSLVDLKTPGRLWAYSKADFAAHAATIAITLLAGVELGVIAGVAVGLLLYLWRAKPTPCSDRWDGCPGFYRNISAMSSGTQC